MSENRVFENRVFENRVFENRVPENRVLRRIFGSRGDKLTEYWRKIHNE